MQISSPSICKVDFVNNVLAEELLNIVEKWYNGLLSIPRFAPFQYFLVRYGIYCTELFKFFAPIICLGIGTRYADLILASSWFLGLDLELKILYSVVIIVAIYQVGSYIGFRGEKIIDSRIQKLQPPPVFDITKGDCRKIQEAKAKNNKFVRELLLQIAVGAVGFLVVTFIPSFVKAILRIQ